MSLGGLERPGVGDEQIQGDLAPLPAEGGPPSYPTRHLLEGTGGDLLSGQAVDHGSAPARVAGLQGSAHNLHAAGAVEGGAGADQGRAPY